MAIPSPEERPDLYDGYDGLPEGHQSSVTVSPRLQELIDEKRRNPREEPAASDPE